MSNNRTVVFYSNVFIDCNNVRSYSTGFRAKEMGSDNYYGDIVVADLNFDNKEDVAIIKDSGGNRGPAYNYYLQGAERKFYLDPYLTDSMVYFPTFIKDDSLITYVHAGACCMGEHIYKLDKRKNWKEVSHKLLEYAVIEDSIPRIR